MKNEEFGYLKDLNKEFNDNIKEDFEKSLDIPKPVKLMTEKERKEYDKKQLEIKTKKQKELVKDARKIKKKIERKAENFYKELILKKSLFEKFMDIFFNRSYMLMGIITKDGSLRIKKVPVKDAYIRYRKGTYDIDTGSMLRYKGRVMNMYFDDNPHPIRFDRNINTPLVNSESLDVMFQARLIKQLFQDGLTTTQKAALSVGAIIAFGIAIVMVIGTLKDVSSKAPIIIPFFWRMFKNGK